MSEFIEGLKNKKITVASHDAGGAEVLSSFLLRNNIKADFVLGGPAVDIFNRKIGDFKLVALQDAAESSDCLLASTSWASDIELRAIKEFKALGKPTYSFMDHWVNFKERYVRCDEVILPDKVIVGDAQAILVAHNCFNSDIVFYEENCYFLDIKEELKKVEKISFNMDVKNILYVSEPISKSAKAFHGDENHWGFTEDEALLYFLHKMHCFGDVNLIIRPHPSEDEEKFNWVLEKNHSSVIIRKNRPLLQEIIDAEIVVGVGSMAMYIGLLANKRVISSIPPSINSYPILPHKCIEQLRQMVFEDHK